MEIIKGDLFFEDVYVFILKGDVIFFKYGLILIDFVYCIYIEVGNYCIGVKVNEWIVFLDIFLKNGDIVEILI